ncbi:NADH:flavin oxidoreductase [Sphingomonas histidinilytica]|uniref:2,4-dienoyl-CoA reductase n=2 Tax=Rhizorhabdus histidinilytica TaxID=439228 RepID=A0A1T5GUY5_9SPHN|nr:NADH:flavin oxidoreductase [Rhizorhabdus histidinilytica]SKC12130.1 2,4-dienoyl-CoA reductase [Rhizorhabdus histidinilytica]
MSKELGKSLALPCGAILRNRLAKSATQEGLADNEYRVSDALCRLYRRWSHGGAGLLVTGDVMVDGAHMERFGNVVLETPDDLPALRRWAAAGQAADNHFWMQINHPGRQTPIRFNPHPFAPSASTAGLPPREFGMPRAMSEDDITDVITRFARTAAISREAGFTGVQLHGAHGFLISQFLSPLANHRNDAWGGSLENRARLLLESVKAIRAAVGSDYPISVKLNSADFQRGGFDIEDSVAVVGMLNGSGIDLLEISGGNISSLAMMGSASDEPAAPKAHSTVKREAYFAGYAERIRPVAGMPLMITGGFRHAADMTAMLVEDRVDMIGMARPLCVDPEICAKLLDGRATSAPTLQEDLILDRGTLPADLDDSAFAYAVSVAQLCWLYLQLARIAQGDDPDFGLPLATAIAELGRIEEQRASVSV